MQTNLAAFRAFPVARLLALLAALTLVSACVSRPAESPQFRDQLPMEAIATQQDIKALQTPGSKDGVLNILALSAGGAYGAYGVGVLTGWSETGTRPQFDVVTGVSTGALISIFAFLGPQYDPLLKELYAEVDSKDILISRGLNGLFSDSLYDNSPLKKQIERYITPQILAAIAAEHDKGRRLYVATTNLDSGQLVVWDMGRIAKGGRTNPVQHFQKVLRASAAVPGFFPPVYIKPQRGVQLRQAHVDGGVKAPLLISDFIFKSPAKEKRLYVIVNDSIAPRDAYAAVQPNLSSIARKSINTLTRELMRQNVQRGFIRAQHSGTQFFLTSVPDRLAANPQTLTFDRKLTLRLFNAGRKQALSSSPWLRRPDGVRSFDVVSR